MKRIDIVLQEAKDELKRASLYGSDKLSYETELRNALIALVNEVDNAITLAEDRGYQRGYDDGISDGYHKRAI